MKSPEEVVCLVYGLVPLSRVLKDLVEPGQGLGSGFGLGFRLKDLMGHALGSRCSVQD